MFASSHLRRRRHESKRPRSSLRVERLEDRLLLSAGIGTAELVRYFDTWDGGVIRSTDVAGITYHSPSGHLYLADSEINELSLFNGDNIFEVSLSGDVVYREITSGNGEPTGIAYSEYDHYFYVTNDVTRKIYRYDARLDTPLKSVKTLDDVSSADDPEGITVNPLTGDLYIADGSGGGRQILVYNANLQYQSRFSVGDVVRDPEGIAFDTRTGTLLLVSTPDMALFEYSLAGEHLQTYDISGLMPTPMAPQGLTFAPTSDPNDDPAALALYIADGMVDNHADGRVYEVLVHRGTVNQPPVVDAGPDQSVPLEDGALLAGMVSDDGLPNPAGLSTLWTAVSGPGTVVFDDATLPGTAVNFTDEGSYVLRLTADDGELSTFDEVTITVLAPSVPPTESPILLDTVGLYNTDTSTFFLTETNEPGPAEWLFRYGPNGVDWKPIAADWDGSGSDTVGLYDPGAGKFYLKNDNAGGYADTIFVFGPSGGNWTPLAGDWEGDGDGSIGLYNPAASQFRLKNTNSAGAADFVFDYGPAGSGWVPVMGDWDGNGSTTVGLYNPQAGKFFLKNTNSAGVADIVFRFGPTNTDWLPVAGDWDADGIDTVGLFDTEAGKFFLRNSHTAGAADVQFRYGPVASGWTPLAGTWSEPVATSTSITTTSGILSASAVQGTSETLADSFAVRTDLPTDAVPAPDTDGPTGELTYDVEEEASSNSTASLTDSDRATAATDSAIAELYQDGALTYVDGLLPSPL